MASSTAQNLPLFDLGPLRGKSGWILALGIVEIILGTLAVGVPVFTTQVTVDFFGWLLLFGGVLSAVHAFWRKQWRGFFFDLVIGILYAVAGFMITVNPTQAAVTLTLLIAMFLLMSGIFRIVIALTGHLQHWGWVLLNGVITAGLGVLIWRQWPLSGLWVIGLFIGIDMIFYGWSLVMLSAMVKRPSPTTPAAAV